MKKGKVVRVSAREDNLKRRLRRHLASVGFERGPDGALQVCGLGKDVIRALHGPHRSGRLKENRKFITENRAKLIRYFATGAEVRPENVEPVLERIASGSWQSELFRLASLMWSIPVSHGFGRRLRYLVWDGSNDKLIGLLAIGDPVFNLSARDELINWNSHQRSDRLVNMMDAYVLGAVPPYNMLLGGKLVAALVRTREIYDDFARAYGNTEGIISGKEKRARLLAVTTTSSLGRSSIYNRLKLGGQEYFKPIGFTGGWGHFHIPDELFSEFRSYLRDIGHSYADLHRFGEGPNWRFRTTRAALAALGFRADLLRHGVQREVFISFLASNAISILAKGSGRPNLSSLLTVSEVGALAINRWLVPRAERRPEFRSWQRSQLNELLEDQRSTLKLVNSK
jgi:hypothetical protein